MLKVVYLLFLFFRLTCNGININKVLLLRYKNTRSLCAISDFYLTRWGHIGTCVYTNKTKMISNRNESNLPQFFQPITWALLTATNNVKIIICLYILIFQIENEKSIGMQWVKYENLISIHTTSRTTYERLNYVDR